MKKLTIVLSAWLVLCQKPAVAQEPPCYLPLAVGNSWSLQYFNGTDHDTLVYSISDTLNANEHLYYLWKSPLGDMYVRYDRIGYIFQYLPELNLEYPLFVFAPGAEDTLTVSIPEHKIFFQVILLSRTERVQTPAGSFDNCLHFFIDRFPGAIDDEQEIWLAPDVGMVQAKRIFDTTEQLILSTTLGGCSSQDRQARLSLDSHTLFFETQSSYDTLFIANIGSDTLAIDSVKAYTGYGWSIEVQSKNLNFGWYVWNSVDRWQFETYKLALAPNDSAFLIFFSPDLCPICKPTVTGVFPFTDTLYIFTNDPAANPAKIFAYGEGRPSAVEDIDIPETIVLQQNYPNPFNPATAIEYELAQGGSRSARHLQFARPAGADAGGWLAAGGIAPRKLGWPQ